MQSSSSGFGTSYPPHGVGGGLGGGGGGYGYGYGREDEEELATTEGDQDGGVEERKKDSTKSTVGNLLGTAVAAGVTLAALDAISRQEKALYSCHTLLLL